MNLTAHPPTRRARRDPLSARGIGRILAMVLVWLGGLLCIAPPLYILGQSLITQSRGRFSRPALLGYISVLQDDRLWNAFKNTAIGELIIIATTLFFCPLAGYGFAKFKFRGRNFLFSVMILTLFFVPLAQLIPLLLEMNAIGWLDTYQAMVAPLAISSLGIFWMVMVIRAVPDEILHAARLDGCGSFSTWWRIVLPLIKPSLLALGFVMFVTAYGDYLWPLLVLPSDGMQTVQLYLQGGGGPYGGGGGSPAALVITSLPAIIAFLLMQHYYMPGSARLNEVPAAAEADVFPFQTAAPTSMSAPAVRLDDAARSATPIAPFRAAIPALVGLRPWLGARTGRIVQCAIIAGWPCLVYLNALHSRFRLDDVYRVVGNPGVENLLPIQRYFTDPSTSAFLPSLAQFRPLLPLTLSINHALTGDSLVGYHLGNLLLVIGAGLVVYFLVRELLGQWAAERLSAYRVDFIATVVALLTVTHPVAAMLVNYISGRDLLLMQLFVGASLYFYSRMRRLSLSASRDDLLVAPLPQQLAHRWFGGSVLGWMAVLVLFELALLAKAQAVMFPALILAFELTLGKGTLSRIAAYARTLPFALVAVGHIVYIDRYLNFAALPDASNIGADALWTYPLTQAKLSLFHYLPNFAWPFNLRQVPVAPTMNSMQDPAVALGLIFIAATLVGAWFLGRAHPLMAFCILAYWIAQSPESSVTPMLHNAVDYRPYPAEPFLFLILALLLNRYSKPAISSILMLLLIVFCGVASIMLNSTW